MNIIDIFNNLSGQSFIDLFFKAFAVLFAFIYLVYAIVVSKQTQVMNETLKSGGAGTIAFFSMIQILVGIGLVLLAIFFI